MCLAFPGKIIEIKGHKALIQYPGETREALVGVKSVKMGDFVLVQMGVVVQIISASQSKEILKSWQNLDQQNYPQAVAKIGKKS